MANMDIAERRAPQDGRISLKTAQGEFDFRVSSYPSVNGENIVIRILDKRSAMIALDKVGMPPDILFSLQELIHRPYGMIIVCGPTGSGKTTTLYGCLNALNSPERASHRGREGTREKSLAGTGQVLQENMTAGNHAGRCQTDHLVLANDDAVDVLFDSPQELSGATRYKDRFPISRRHAGPV